MMGRVRDGEGGAGSCSGSDGKLGDEGDESGEGGCCVGGDSDGGVMVMMRKMGGVEGALWW